MGLFKPNIARMKAKGDVEGLVRALSHKDVEVWADAKIALKDLHDARAIQPLITQLSSADFNVRGWAAELLGLLRASQAVEPLIAALRDNTMRKAAIEALGMIGDARAVEPLMAIVHKHYDENARIAAAEALVRIGKPAVEPFIIALKEDAKDVRQVAAEALVKIGTPAVEPLINLLHANDLNLSKKAAEALGQIGWNPGKDENGARYWITQDRWDKCIEIGTPAVEQLIRALPQPAAAEALGRIGTPAVEPLFAALEHGDPSVRQAAVKVLGKIGDTRALKPLISVLGDDHVREGTVKALDRLGWCPGEDENGARYWIGKNRWDICIKIGRPAVEPLLAAIKASDQHARRAAIEALGKIGDGRAVEPLISALMDHDVCQAATEALVKIGQPAMQPLIPALQHTTTEVAKAAAEVLERLGWHPGEDEDGARYWITKNRWDKCIEIGKPAVEPLLRWLFQTPQRGSLEQIARDRPFGDHTDLILEASSYGPITETYWDEGVWPSEEIRHTEYNYSLEGGDKAITSLCASKNPLSTNLLHLVAEKPDAPNVMFPVEGSQKPRMGTLSFAYQRQRARTELKARGDPAYDPELYKQAGIWDLPPASTH